LCTVVAACVVDVAFVIDNSGSIRDNDPPDGNNWQLILDFVKSIISELIIAPYATRVAVVDFGKLAVFWARERPSRGGIDSKTILEFNEHTYRASLSLPKSGRRL